MGDRALDSGDLPRGAAKHPGAFRTISEVAVELDVPQHVLRFWETKFPQIKPLKRGGGRRYYRPEDVALLKGIRHLLYSDGYTIKGVQKVLRENGAQAVIAVAKPLAERLADHRTPPPIVTLSPSQVQEDVADESPDESALPGGPEGTDADDAAPDTPDDLRALVRDLRAELAAIRAILAGKSKN
ncbi:MerR family transcriptional regulator [Oleomonas cavernae]|uniref:MerR family transcriptional regulator n=1 Tax=Oleomonas cavernae TaxID=2320859 RepID=A0A418WAB6_9PROT|nr:MerR family transcriptional regulator [Oleomonas cavernae]RJF86962.1 MerR family transcriptional regulator [Oleomonas cavernae]